MHAFQIAAKHDETEMENRPNAETASWKKEGRMNEVQIMWIDIQ